MKLRTLRRAKDITQEQLADMVGVQKSTISDLERGKSRNPSWETVARIADVFKVDPRELFPLAGTPEAKAAEAILAERRKQGERRHNRRSAPKRRKVSR